MAIRVNPKLITELEKYGAADVSNCYHCGNCSAACPFSKEPFLIPRKSMRLLQMGLETKLRGTIEPWLCYYCGECSEQCPRGAEPGETMMSLRRWLTSRYDFTGISRLFYRSWKAEAAALAIVGVLTGIGFLAWGLTHGSLQIYDGPGAFLSSSAVHRFDWGMAALLSLLLGINAVRMWWFTTGSHATLRIPFLSYLKNFSLLPLHFFTQKRYGQCSSRQPWLVHLGLMASYVTMLVLIMFFLRLMQDGPEIRWGVHAFGYVASIGLLGAVIYAMIGRLRKRQAHLRHSHESDWIFLGMLLAVTATGILQHILHRHGPPLWANLAYVAHMMLVVPMLTLEVPFSKWAHMAYRPLAMYLAQLHADALARRRASEEHSQPVKAAA
jgi:quinone-modifying oxidoreductase, subunit QmoC